MPDHEAPRRRLPATISIMACACRPTSDDVSD
jgi:hypothetical protein